jgi:hypothetical protein
LAAGEGNAALRARDLGGTANTAALTSAVLDALTADAMPTSASEPAFSVVELRD